MGRSPRSSQYCEGIRLCRFLTPVNQIGTYWRLMPVSKQVKTAITFHPDVVISSFSSHVAVATSIAFLHSSTMAFVRVYVNYGEIVPLSLLIDVDIIVSLRASNFSVDDFCRVFDVDISSCRSLTRRYPDWCQAYFESSMIDPCPNSANI